MKILQAIENVDKSRGNEGYIQITDFAYDNFGISLNIGYIEDDDMKLKSYFLGNWFCTDNMVGYKVYLLNDIPVAFSTQFGRKLNENFYWLGDKEYGMVKKYILSLLEEDEDSTQIQYIDTELDFDTYKVEFSEQLTKDHLTKALYKGVPVLITNTNPLNKSDIYGIINNIVRIEYDGKEVDVRMVDLDFTLNLKK